MSSGAAKKTCSTRSGDSCIGSCFNAAGSITSSPSAHRRPETKHFAVVGTVSVLVPPRRRANAASTSEPAPMPAEADTAYRLIRKDAFIKNGNLNGAFQRLQEEPKSKKNQVSNIYAAVLLNHSFLSGIAAYSAYIQSHKTTNTSESFETIMDYICVNLQNAIAILKGKSMAKNPDKCFEAFEVLDKKYAELNLKRNLEIESGILTMSKVR